MKAIFCCIFGLGLGLGLATVGHAMSPEDEALQILARAAQVEDHAHYEELLNTLGFDFSRPRSTVVTQQGVDHPAVLGRRRELDVTPSQRTVLAAAASNADYSAFVPQGEHFARTGVSFSVDGARLCITRVAFEKAFSPVEHIVATDGGGEHPEHTFLGKHVRHIAVFFDQDGCVMKVYLNQSS